MKCKPENTIILSEDHHEQVLRTLNGELLPVDNEADENGVKYVRDVDGVPKYYLKEDRIYSLEDRSVDHPLFRRRDRLQSQFGVIENNVLDFVDHDKRAPTADFMGKTATFRGQTTLFLDGFAEAGADVVLMFESQTVEIPTNEYGGFHFRHQLPQEIQEFTVRVTDDSGLKTVYVGELFENQVAIFSQVETELFEEHRARILHLIDQGYKPVIKGFDYSLCDCDIDCKKFASKFDLGNHVTEQWPEFSAIGVAKASMKELGTNLIGPENPEGISDVYPVQANIRVVPQDSGAWVFQATLRDALSCEIICIKQSDTVPAHDYRHAAHELFKQIKEPIGDYFLAKGWQVGDLIEASDVTRPSKEYRYAESPEVSHDENRTLSVPSWLEGAEVTVYFYDTNREQTTWYHPGSMEKPYEYKYILRDGEKAPVVPGIVQKISIYHSGHDSMFYSIENYIGAFGSIMSNTPLPSSRCSTTVWPQRVNGGRGENSQKVHDVGFALKDNGMFEIVENLVVGESLSQIGWAEEYPLYSQFDNKEVVDFLRYSRMIACQVRETELAFGYRPQSVAKGIELIDYSEDVALAKPEGFVSFSATRKVSHRSTVGYHEAFHLIDNHLQISDLERIGELYGLINQRYSEFFRLLDEENFINDESGGHSEDNVAELLASLYASLYHPDLETRLEYATRDFVDMYIHALSVFKEAIREAGVGEKESIFELIDQALGVASNLS